ncbi:hypothetical protein ACOSQ3_021046 [Xanthoceras sorbifolium]
MCFIIFLLICSIIVNIESVRILFNQPLKASTTLPYLELCKREKLKSIYWKALFFPQLKEISVRYCPNVKKLPLDSNSRKAHKIVIEVQERWWRELQWEDQATRNAFLPCFDSTVGREHVARHLCAQLVFP